MSKYSVIIPAYNRAPFLRRAVSSVVDQDCIPRGQIQVVVIDDGSTDNTPKLMEAMKSNVSQQEIDYVRIDHIGEPGSVRNIGLKRAEGEFIAYCDSDDYWLPHHLATAEQSFKKDASLGMVSNYWGLARFEMVGGSIRTTIVVPPHPVWAVNTNCRVHRRECLKVGYFNRKKWGEDSDFFTRIEQDFKHHKTGVVSSVNGYIKGGNNLTYQFDAGVRGTYF